MAIGLSLGLLGSGGSILTVPVLVYLVGQDEKLAIAGSLAVGMLAAPIPNLSSVRAILIGAHWKAYLLLG